MSFTYSCSSSSCSDAHEDRSNNFTPHFIELEDPHGNPLRLVRFTSRNRTFIIDHRGFVIDIIGSNDEIVNAAAMGFTTSNEDTGHFGTEGEDEDIENLVRQRMLELGWTGQGARRDGERALSLEEMARGIWSIEVLSARLEDREPQRDHLAGVSTAVWDERVDNGTEERRPTGVDIPAELREAVNGINAVLSIIPIGDIPERLRQRLLVLGPIIDGGLLLELDSAGSVDSMDETGSDSEDEISWTNEDED